MSHRLQVLVDDAGFPEVQRDARPAVHVATMDRRSFGQIGSEGQHFLRISIATGLADLREALGLIRKAANDRGGFLEFVAEGKYSW